MCVDFAYKQIEEKGEKWGLRNIKLRMSRRLIFVKGLLMCAKLYKSSYSMDQIKEELRKFVAEKPLDFMVSCFLEFGVSDENIVQALESYNKYLAILNDEHYREYLRKLDMYKAYGDSQFEAVRSNSNEFKEALNNVFLRQPGHLSEFAIKYGVF